MTLEKLFWASTTTSVCLKLDQAISWDWVSVFWAYWIVFSLLILVSIGVLLITCGAAISFVTSQIEAYECIQKLTNLHFSFCNIMVLLFDNWNYILLIFIRDEPFKILQWKA